MCEEPERERSCDQAQSWKEPLELLRPAVKSANQIQSKVVS